MSLGQKMKRTEPASFAFQGEVAFFTLSCSYREVRLVPGSKESARPDHVSR